MANEKRYAVLIDGENISHKYVKVIMDEISNEGVATYKRIYGDWTDTIHKSWKDVLLQHSITPIQQYSYSSGKNASDSAMIIDAMDILYSERVDGFCLVSSDSDFTRLASRLRESGIHVIGMGESKTPKPFVVACNQFKCLDILFAQQSSSTTLPDKIENNSSLTGMAELMSPQTDLDTIIASIMSIVSEQSSDDGWIFLGTLGNVIAKRFPDFDIRNYGYKKLNELVKTLDSFEIETRNGAGGIAHMYVKLREELKE